MKTINTILFVLMAGLLSQSCSKLDVLPRGGMTGKETG